MVAYKKLNKERKKGGRLTGERNREGAIRSSILI